MTNTTNKGFSLIELLITIALIGTISTIVYVSLGSTRIKSRDTKRKSDIAQIGRFLSLSCYLPQAGEGIYDLADLITELKAAYPQYTNFLTSTPKDPKIGTDIETYYYYSVTQDGKDCALYANLENEDEPVTNANINSPTAGGGQGVLQALSPGWNDSTKYFQYSN